MDPIITLLTDFGLEDHYAASVKGVALSICQNARLVDVTHLIPPQDVRAGAFVLGAAYASFPIGSVHLAVVDPGVGTSRRALAVSAHGHFFIGPDNGIFAWVLEGAPDYRAVSLENREYWRSRVSATFHGRDIFGPVAAHLASGVPLEALGLPCTPSEPPWRQRPIIFEDIVEGEVIHVDRFGNAISNIRESDIGAFVSGSRWTVHAAGRRVPLVFTYGEAETGTPVALIGSCGHLEIAVVCGSAARKLGLRPGDPIQVLR
jgi:S-adenosylmethionine hydrolase